jgi:chaperone modulatory protein CbpM
MKLKLQRKIEEVCVDCELSQDLIIKFVQEEWIIPYDSENYFFDEEDVARIKLIIDLQNNFGVNDEAIAIILHLVDQLNSHKSP